MSAPAFATELERELYDALAAALVELRQSAEFFGPCDHDVGSCCCPLYGLIDRCDAALTKASKP